MSNNAHVQNIEQKRLERQETTCPECGGKLVLRNGKNGKFYGCSNFPKCRYTANFEEQNFTYLAIIIKNEPSVPDGTEGSVVV